MKSHHGERPATSEHLGLVHSALAGGWCQGGTLFSNRRPTKMRTTMKLGSVRNSEDANVTKLFDLLGTFYRPIKEKVRQVPEAFLNSPSTTSVVTKLVSEILCDTLICLPGFATSVQTRIPRISHVGDGGNETGRFLYWKNFSLKWPKKVAGLDK